MAHITVEENNLRFTLSDDGQILTKVSRVDGYPEDNCLDLTHLTFTTVGPKAFEGLDNVETLVLPRSVCEIKSGAFTGCALLERLCLVVSQLPEVSIDAFVDCSSLKKLYLGSNENVFSKYKYKGLFSYVDVVSSLVSACQRGSVSQLKVLFSPRNKPERIGVFQLPRDAAAAKSFLVSPSKVLVARVDAGHVSIGAASAPTFFRNLPASHESNESADRPNCTVM